MKNLKLLAIVMTIASFGFFTSCTEDTDPIGPSIDWQNYDGADLEITVGDAVEISFMVSQGDKKLETVEATVTTSGTTETLINTADSSDSPSDGDVYTITRTFTNANTYTITITVTDKDELTATETVNVIVSEEATALTSLGSFDLGSYNNSTGSFFSVTNSKIYTVSTAADNQADVDLVYYYESTNEATIAAPDDSSLDDFTSLGVSSWTTQNATRFATTDLDFDTATDQDIADLSASASVITKLSVGDVIYYETVDDEVGLIEITAITSGADGTASISVNMK